MPDDVPQLGSTNHLLPLDLTAELCFYDGGPMKAFVRSSSEQPIIRANREKLREVLSTGLDVQWSRSIRKVEESSGNVRLTFDDGHEASGHVLVGADGAGSFGITAQSKSSMTVNVANDAISPKPSASRPETEHTASRCDQRRSNRRG